MLKNQTRAVLCGLAVVASVTACGGDAATSTSAPATTVAATTTTVTADTTPASTAPAAPTELRFTISGLADYQGFYLLAEVIDPTTDEYVGSVCWLIDADPWSGTGTIRTAAASDPCTYDPPYGEVLTTDGRYHYVVGIHEAGQPAAACVVGDVVVDGPTELALSGAEFVTPCPETITRG